MNQTTMIVYVLRKNRNQNQMAWKYCQC